MKSLRTALGLLQVVLGASALLACAPSPRIITQPQSPGAKVEDAEDDVGSAWLRDTSRAAIAAGAGPLQLVSYGSGVPGDTLDGFVFVPPGHCALVYARGSASIEDLDLHSYGDDGTQFGVDEAPDNLPTLMLCPKTGKRLYLAARIAQGQGFASLGMHNVPRGRSQEVARAVGARGASTHVAKVDSAWPGLSEALSRHRAKIGGDWLDQRRVALPLDSRLETHLSVEIPRQKCLDILVLPTKDIGQVQLTALDEQGRIFMRGREEGRNRAMVLCSENAISITLGLRPHSGRGLAVATVSSSQVKIPQLHLASDSPLFYLQGASLPNAPPPRLPKPQHKKKFTLQVGRLSSWTFPVNGCARIDLLPQAPLLGFEARVWSPRGHLRAQAKLPWHGPLFVCGKKTLRLDIEASRRAGPLLAHLGRSSSVDAALLEHPLAASRLLGKGSEEGILRLPHEIGAVTALQLSSHELKKIPIEVPVAHCFTFLAAKDAQGVGLEARILRNDGPVEESFVRGTHSIATTVCAGKASKLSATLELRTQGGKSWALWSSRQFRK